jgi:endonuclease/exonuclease/phosphatase (EEP) superfamily protein YafD
LLCGDFNPTLGQHWEPGIRQLHELGFENAFADRWRTLDNCFAAGHSRIEHATKLNLNGSDHKPIVVQVVL